MLVSNGATEASGAISRQRKAREVPNDGGPEEEYQRKYQQAEAREGKTQAPTASPSDGYLCPQINVLAGMYVTWADPHYSCYRKVWTMKLNV